MQVRFTQRQLGRLSARAVHFLRQTNYELIARALHGAPAALRAYAERLRKAEDELRFRRPLAPFAAFLGDVAGLADAAALEKESARLAALRRRRGWFGGTAALSGKGGGRIATHGLARFTDRARFSRRGA